MRKIRKKRRGRDPSLQDYVERIYVREDTERIAAGIEKKRVKQCIVLAVLTVTAFVYCCLQPVEQSPLAGNKLQRQKDTSQMSIVVSGESDSGEWEREMLLTVKNRQFSSVEKEKISQKVKLYLEKTIKGKNDSIQMVWDSLCLPQGVPETEVNISWTLDEDYLSLDGELKYDNIPQKGTDTEILAKASWNNWQEKYSFPIHLMGKKYTRQEQTLRQVKQALEQAEKSQENQGIVVLPQQVGDVKLKYSMEEGEHNFTLVYLLLGTFVLLPFLWRQQQKKELQQREEQLLLDYPGMINKFMLLLGAGLTVRKVVERLAGEYERSREKGGEKRFLYEEICIMSREIKDGVSEVEVLEHFGKRCRLLPYLRFSSIMKQNLKKGAEGILQILEKESLEALEQRKQRVLQLGEKAGTKLLFPMMLMLGIVMAIIMVPAFMTM